MIGDLLPPWPRLRPLLESPHHLREVSGGTGSSIGTPASAAARPRSRCPKPRARMNVNQANGRAMKNVINNPTLVESMAMIKLNVTAATGKAVTL